MRFLPRVEEVTLFNKVRSSEIRKSLNIEPLLLQIERSWFRWLGHVRRMPQEGLPKQTLLSKSSLFYQTLKVRWKESVKRPCGHQSQLHL